jgi:hypothetical protein
MDTIKQVFFDEDYEYQLLKLIIGTSNERGERDYRYGKKSVKLIERKYFSNTFIGDLFSLIEAHYSKYMSIPSYKDLKAMIGMDESISKEKKEFLVDTLKKVSRVKIENVKFVENSLFEYITRQNVLDFCFTKIKSIKSGEEKLADMGDFMASVRELQRKLYFDEHLVELVPDAPFDFKADGERVDLGWGKYFDDLIDFRKGRVAVGVVPTSVGKTTSSIVAAKENFLKGRKVLLVYFEDYPSDLMKKVYAGIGAYHIRDISNDLERKFPKINKKIKEGYESGGRFAMIKKKQGETTPQEIREACDAFIAQHGGLDFLIIDYLDCLRSSQTNKRYSSVYEEQGDVVIDVLNLASDLEYNVACLTFIQAGRTGLDKAIVSMAEAGGSISRVFKAFVVFTFSKTPSQKRNSVANVFLEKNRGGEAGILFKDVEFCNSSVSIKIDEKNIEAVDDLMA